MTLDEAIKHAEEVAETIEKRGYYIIPKNIEECATEHRQLAEWLKELKMLKEFMEEDFGTLCQRLYTDLKAYMEEK